jgi:hypothetical protein
MTVMVLSRWSAQQEDVERIGRKLKSFYEKHGAKFEIDSIFSGSYAGEFLAIIWYADWERFGRTMYALSKDTEYQEALAEAHRRGEMRGRSIVVGLELSDESQN